MTVQGRVRVIQGSTARGVARRVVCTLAFCCGYCFLAELLGSGKCVRILCYHGVGNRPANAYAVSTPDFARQMQFLVDRSSMMSVDQLIELLRVDQWRERCQDRPFGPQADEAGKARRHAHIRDRNERGSGSLDRAAKVGAASPRTECLTLDKASRTDSLCGQRGRRLSSYPRSSALLATVARPSWWRTVQWVN